MVFDKERSFKRRLGNNAIIKQDTEDISQLLGEEGIWHEIQWHWVSGKHLKHRYQNPFDIEIIVKMEDAENVHRSLKSHALVHDWDADDLEVFVEIHCEKNQWFDLGPYKFVE